MNSMRDLFPEWYRPDADAMLRLHQDATIVPDTNVLLAVYRMGKLAADIFDAFEMHKDRLWVPHQVALEYQRNRLRVINEQSKKFTDFETAWSAMDEAVKATARTGGDDLLAAMTQRLELAYASMFGDIDVVRKENAPADPTPAGLDPHRDRWDSILEGKINPRPPHEVIESRQDEAQKRAERSIPPGYLDTKKKEGQPEGDYLIWCEALDQAKLSNRPLIFITNDKKADWYETVSGQTVGPRPELRREMHEHTGGQTYWQEDLQTFLFYSARLRSAKVRPETIKRLDETTPPSRATSSFANLTYYISSRSRDSSSSSDQYAVDDELMRQLFIIDDSESVALDWKLDRDVLDKIAALSGSRGASRVTFRRLMHTLRGYYNECEQLQGLNPEADPDAFVQAYSDVLESKKRVQALVRRLPVDAADVPTVQSSLQDLDQVLDERSRNGF